MDKPIVEGEREHDRPIPAVEQPSFNPKKKYEGEVNKEVPVIGILTQPVHS